MQDLRKHITQISYAAGEAITEVWRNSDKGIAFKHDNSPLTQADLRSEVIIRSALESLQMGPVISEEAEFQMSAVEQDQYWLVDPLDGTRDFIAGHKTFAVCIALMRQRQPVLGVIHAPLLQETYSAVLGEGSTYNDTRIFNRRRTESWIALGSRSSPSPKMIEFLGRLPLDRIDRIGSALKFGRIARGDADFYLRFGPTYEWDTAAGQLILQEAGGEIYDLKTKLSLLYGKPALKNTGFLAATPLIARQILESFAKGSIA